MRLEQVVRGCGLFDADDHGLETDEVLDAGVGEAGLFHPDQAVGAGVVEAAYEPIKTGGQMPTMLELVRSRH
jgi:hypothetical protein